MKSFIVPILLFTLFTPSVSADNTAKIEELMRAQGVLEMWQQQIKMGEVESKKQADKMLEQFMSQLSPSKEFTDRFNKASKKFIEKLQGNWTAKEIVAVWAKYYGPKFTEPELDQLIEFYTSDIGQKEVQAGKVAVVEFTRYFQKENEAIMKSAINDYISDLKLIAQECKCKKQK